jgi:lycopene beta-cyclase
MTTYDIAIIGAGAAGLQLALALRADASFSRKKILLLEKDAKDRNDRTWCFWEKGAGKWDHLLHRSWSQGDFFSEKIALPLALHPYRYKMLRGLDFYDFAKKELAATSNFTWQTDVVRSVENTSPLRIAGERDSYPADQVFDSRLPEAFFQKNDPYTRLLQHFKGWFVRTPGASFDPTRFTMMDYRLRWHDTTSFAYVLPFSEQEALVEFTLFSPHLLDDGDYDLMLRRYFSEILKINTFEVVATEYGIIPMSDFPFEKYSRGRHVRIGTAGGWVKPSSGYSFKNCERHAHRIAGNLKAGKPALQGLISSKFRFYDAVFLDVLHRRNDLGPHLFEVMYQKNPIQTIFAFLDDETHLGQDIGILASFPKPPFLRSLLHYLTR